MGQTSLTEFSLKHMQSYTETEMKSKLGLQVSSDMVMQRSIAESQSIVSGCGNISGLQKPVRPLAMQMGEPLQRFFLTSNIL